MTARIYKPSKAATQSGMARTKQWLLVFEQDKPREIEPLMGWTASGDTRQQLRLWFDTARGGGRLCRAARASPTGSRSRTNCKRRAMSYSDNFKFNRVGPWTH